MSDNSSCFFNRHRSTIIHYPESSTHPDRGKNVFLLELSEEDWDVLSNSEFSNRLAKAMLLGISFIQIEGSDSHQYMKFLRYILPLVSPICRVRVCVDGCRTLFLENIAFLTDGICVDVRIPLKQEYSKKDRDVCKVSGDYRSPSQYRDLVRSTIGLVDHLPLSIFRVHRDFMTKRDIRDTVSYLSEFRSPVIVGR